MNESIGSGRGKGSMDGVEANGVYRISVASFSVALESKIVTKQISEMQGYEGDQLPLHLFVDPLKANAAFN